MFPDTEALIYQQVGSATVTTRSDLDGLCTDTALLSAIAEALFTSTALMALLMAVTRCVLTPFLHFLCVYVEAATIMFIAISAFANECLRAHIGHSCVPAPAKILYITGLICFRSQWSPSGL